MWYDSINKRMGVSLLGLATSKDTCVKDSFGPPPAIDINWSDCNFLGCDLSHLGVGYANGIAQRWGVSDRVGFRVAPVEEMLVKIQKSYPGEVALITINFPTPYRLSTDTQNSDECATNMNNLNDDGNHGISSGNPQLPHTPTTGFMVTSGLLKTARVALTNRGGNGQLLLQSNCEDVAIEMRNMALDRGFCTAPVPVETRNLDDQLATRRTKNWIAATSPSVRAEGAGWSAEPLVPTRGATETEVSCLLNGTPVHRCLFYAAS